MAESTDGPPPAEAGDKRRSFLVQFITGLVGAVVGAVPLLSGLAVFLSPLGRKAEAGKWIRVASLDAVPPDGRPYLFPVISERTDAWSHYPPEPIGAVYLRRASADATPVAMTNVCPHLGCAVDWKSSSDEFQCPCHNSKFEIDGKRVDPENSPSPRGMDGIEVRVEEGQVLVNYKKFKGGVEEKIEE